MKIQNLWALPRSYQNCAVVASPSCEHQPQQEQVESVKNPVSRSPSQHHQQQTELTLSGQLISSRRRYHQRGTNNINNSSSCPATTKYHLDGQLCRVSATAATDNTDTVITTATLYSNIHIPLSQQQPQAQPYIEEKEEELLAPSSADSSNTVAASPTTNVGTVLRNSSNSKNSVVTNSNVLAGDRDNKPQPPAPLSEEPFLNCNTAEEEETKDTTAATTSIGNSGSVVGSSNIATTFVWSSRKNHQTPISIHRQSVFPPRHYDTSSAARQPTTSVLSPPHRSSSSTSSTVFSIGPCFAKLKRIVTSVRRSRSSSARMSVSGTKRKSSPPTFQSPTSSGGGSVLSNEGAASGPAIEDQDDSPSNPTKMRRRQTSQPSMRSLTPSVASTLANCLSKSLESTHSSTASSNAVVSGALPFHQHASSSSSPQSKSRFIPDVYSNNVHFFSRLRKSRKDSNSIVAAVPLSDVQRKEFELPFKLRVQLDQPPISHEAQLKHSWNDQDKSLNIVILPHTNSLIFRRYPVAQSTDCIRGKIGFSSGLHIWEIKWPVNQRGTHAVIGVATKDAPLHCSGYKSLIGSNGESWGWDIGRSKLMHDYTNNQPKVYPSHILDKDEIIIVPEKVTVILDMDEGTLAYMVDGQYLGVAFSGLKQANKPLYPIVSAVWGHCEVEMTYLHASQAMTMQSIARYQIRRYLRQLFYQLKHSLSSATVFDSNNQLGEINSNNNGNCTAATTLPPSVTAALFNQITSSSSSAIDIVNSSAINCVTNSACGSSSGGSPTNNSPLSAGNSGTGNNPNDAGGSASSYQNQFDHQNQTTTPFTCVNIADSSSVNAAAAVAMSEHLSKKLFPHPSQSVMAASDLIQMVPLNTGINVPEWLFKSSSTATVAALGQVSNENNSNMCMMQQQLSVMSPLCSLSFTGLPPGCNTDSQFIEYHVERLQIPTCLKHYLI